MSGSHASQNMADARVARWFATTHWSVVLNAADPSARGSDEALEKLAREEIAHTVANPAEIQEELHDLIELVGG